jgi:hypothetical protein
MQLIRLKDIGKNHTFTVTKYEELARQFVSQEEDIKKFLINKNMAITLEKQKLTSTYLILNDKSNVLLGFFSFCPQNTDLSKTEASVSHKQRKKLIGSKYDKDDKTT